MKLRYTPEARSDLKAIEQYIGDELSNPTAAKRIITGLLKSCSQLKEQPLLGIYLEKKIGRETDLYYLISGKHLIFYRVEADTVSVIRILDGRTNYLQVLLHDLF